MCKQTLASVISVRSSSDTMTSILTGGTAHPMIIQSQHPSSTFRQIYIHTVKSFLKLIYLRYLQNCFQGIAPHTSEHKNTINDVQTLPSG